jgi:multiple sugar transport system permease protein
MLWNREFHGQNVVRGLALLPLLVAPLILSLLWNFMLDFDFGMFNQVLQAVGLKKVYWWAPNIALFTICAITIWQWLPFSVFVLLAGLKGLPRDVFEAARVDGARGWYTFRRLTLPMLTPLIMIIIVLRSCGCPPVRSPVRHNPRRGQHRAAGLDHLSDRLRHVRHRLRFGHGHRLLGLHHDAVHADVPAADEGLEAQGIGRKVRCSRRSCSGW